MDPDVAHHPTDDAPNTTSTDAAHHQVLPRGDERQTPSTIETQKTIEAQGGASANPNVSTAKIQTATSDERLALTKSTTKRKVCAQCSRPASVCLCEFFPSPKIQNSVKVLILTHPKEAEQKMRTGPLSMKCLANCATLVGRNFENEEKYAELHEALKLAEEEGSNRVLTLFPSDDAVSLGNDIGNSNGSVSEQVRWSNAKVLIVIDATWKYAAQMYKANSTLLKHTTKIFIEPGAAKGQFFARVPPKDGYVSTHEAIVQALKVIDPTIFELPSTDANLMAPLHAMVRMQLERTKQVKHRPNRPGYVENLFAPVPEASKSVLNVDETTAAGIPTTVNNQR